MSKATNGARVRTFVIVGIGACFALWAFLFIQRSSVTGIDGERYFALFDDAMISMHSAVRRVMMEVLNPLSSMNTSRLASKRAASHRHKPLASSSRSEAMGDFFERPAAARQARDPPAHRGRRYLHPVDLLQRLAMLRERRVGVVFEPGREPFLEQGTLPGGRTGYRRGRNVAGFPSPPESALDRGHADPEDARHLLAGYPAIDGVQRLEPEVFGVRSHAG